MNDRAAPERGDDRARNKRGPEGSQRTESPPRREGAVSRAKSAPDVRAVARADRKPCAHDQPTTNRGTDDRTTEPSAVDRADAAPDASADDA